MGVGDPISEGLFIVLDYKRIIDKNSPCVVAMLFDVLLSGLSE